MSNQITNLARLVAGRWRWRKARTMADLANLQANEIARRLDTMAFDDPKAAMYGALVALGRAGVVVQDWRPGNTVKATDDLPEMGTRACVVGFADEETKDWLDTVLYFAGKRPGAVDYKLSSILELWARGCEEYDRGDGDDSYRWSGHAVERIDGDATSWLGRSTDARERYRAFPTGRRLRKDLRKSWQITILAPDWGDSTMWSDLIAILDDAARGVFDDAISEYAERWTS